LHSQGFKHSLKRACERASLPYGRNIDNGITFHDFRRTAKTNMLKAGVRGVYRDLIIGHSLKGMDIHYIAPSDDDLHEAMQIYTDWLEGQLESENVDKALTNTGT
jgi:integrase